MPVDCQLHTAEARDLIELAQPIADRAVASNRR